MKPQTTNDVLEVMTSYIDAAALGTAMELGLFWLLAEQPQDAAGVAQALGIPMYRCQCWLEYLANMGLLERVAEGYAPSPTAQTAVLDTYSQETWALLAQEEREYLPAVRDLALHIHKPISTWAAQGLKHPSYVARMEESPERARRFTRMLYELHQPFADNLAKSLDMKGVQRLMDLGGGSGVVSLALLRRHADLTAVVVDIANVCAAGREIAAENSMEDRITYHAANVLDDELPSGFSMVLECDVGVFDGALFRKLRDVLNPGGRLVIVDMFAPAAGAMPLSILYRAFRVSLGESGFTVSTVAEIQAKLTQAGFQLLSEWTLSGPWTVIEARR